MHSILITLPPRRNLSIIERMLQSRHFSTSTLWSLILEENTKTFLRNTIVIDCPIKKLLLIWILKLWRKKLMVWLSSNYLNLHLHYSKAWRATLWHIVILMSEPRTTKVLTETSVTEFLYLHTMIITLKIFHKRILQITRGGLGMMNPFN